MGTKYGHQRRHERTSKLGTTFKAGSGSGKFLRGKRITNISQIRKGVLLIEEDKQFNAINVIKVTQVFKDGFYGIFVNPNKPSVKRLSGDEKFRIWDYHLRFNNYYLARIRKKLQKIPYTETELKDLRTLTNEEFKKKYGSSIPYFIWYRERFKKDFI